MLSLVSKLSLGTTKPYICASCRLRQRSSHSRSLAQAESSAVPEDYAIAETPPFLTGGRRTRRPRTRSAPTDLSETHGIEHNGNAQVHSSEHRLRRPWTRGRLSLGRRSTPPRGQMRRPFVRRILSDRSVTTLRAIKLARLRKRKTPRFPKSIVRRVKTPAWAAFEDASDGAEVTIFEPAVEGAKQFEDDEGEEDSDAVLDMRTIEKAIAAQLRASFTDDKKNDQDTDTGTTHVSGIKRISSSSLKLKPIVHVEQPPIPRLHHGLDRVLFNPGVYQLQDPRTKVFNFDPYLQKILPVPEFNFKALQEYATSSQDAVLGQLAADEKMKYYGSTSSMTGMLRHFHFLLSQNRPLNFSMLTQAFEVKNKYFSRLVKAPAAVFLRYQNKRYAIDADKSFDSANVMSLLGHTLEKLLTEPVTEFERYKLSRSRGKTKDEPQNVKRNSYNYTSFRDILMRSQLDAYDPRLPGTGVFDVKTRGVVSVRAHFGENLKAGLGYELRQEFGQWESFEREHYDMLRTTMLGYSLQARMGRMDGIFAAYHNTERIFGFQYFGLEDLDLGLHGQHDRILGDQEFVLSLALLRDVLTMATKKFPKQSLRMHFETRSVPSFMYVFVEPMTEKKIDSIQTRNQESNERITRSLLGLEDSNEEFEPREGEAEAWRELRAKVENDMAGIQEANHRQSRIGRYEQRLVDIQRQSQELKEDVHRKLEAISQESTKPQTPDASATNGSKKGTRLVSETITLKKRLATLEYRVRKQDDGAADLLYFINDIKASIDDRVLDLDSIAPGEMSPKTVAIAKDRIEARSRVVAYEVSDEKQQEGAQQLEKAEEEGDDEQDEEASDFAGSTDAEAALLLDTDTDKPLLALTIVVRNKVNEVDVKRPENLMAEDVWSVEYAIDDVKDGRKAWTLYHACKARRQDQLDREKEVDYGLRLFQSEVAKWAAKGKEWREQQDRMEQGREAVVYEPYGPSKGPGRKRSATERPTKSTTSVGRSSRSRRPKEVPAEPALWKSQPRERRRLTAKSRAEAESLSISPLIVGP